MPLGSHLGTILSATHIQTNPFFILCPTVDRNSKSLRKRPRFSLQFHVYFVNNKSCKIECTWRLFQKWTVHAKLNIFIIIVQLQRRIFKNKICKIKKKKILVTWHLSHLSHFYVSMLKWGKSFQISKVLNATNITQQFPCFSIYNSYSHFKLYAWCWSVIIYCTRIVWFLFLTWLLCVYSNYAMLHNRI